MTMHPAVFMAGIWAACALAFAILPYQLLNRQLTGYGFLVLGLFIGAFLAGTWLVRRPAGQSATKPQPARLDARFIETVLLRVSLLAGLLLMVDAWDKDLLDLATAYELRSATADALLKGEASNSTIWFQIAFLLYPASYVFIAVHILYAPRINVVRLIGCGLIPIAIVTMVMGGRAPLFYAVLVGVLCLRERRNMMPARPASEQGFLYRHRKLLIGGAGLGLFALLTYYFAAVFIVRAETAGGITEMFASAEQNWGVGFRGPTSELYFGLFGEEVTYLVFVFSWYLVQGLVMANYLFSDYDGPLQLGIYGVDLASAVMRRVTPERVTEGFESLLSLGVYGFLPSAWGSLYVDFGFAGLPLCLLWGYFAALTHKRCHYENRSDWKLIGPFVNLGIFFSLINTPIGFTNGLVTYAWLLVAFLLLNRAYRMTGSTITPVQGAPVVCHQSS